jgi:hypothetical protein
MRFAGVAEVKDRPSAHLKRDLKSKGPHIPEQDLDQLDWRRLANRRLSEAWEGEEDALYDYL